MGWLRRPVSCYVPAPRSGTVPRSAQRLERFLEAVHRCRGALGNSTHGGSHRLRLAITGPCSGFSG
jgi:hypothetical protein